MRVILTISFLAFISDLYSQTAEVDVLKISYAQYDSILGINYIPLEALNGHYDLVMIGFDYDTVEVKSKSAIEISWSSNNIDGRYTLVILPSQIYLRSEHEIPTPIAYIG